MPAEIAGGRPTAVLAGAGELPRHVIEAARRLGRPVYALGFHGYTDAETLRCAPSAKVRLGAAGEAIATLRAWGVIDLVMAGKIERPSLSALRPDARAARLLARISGRALGDDNLLRAVATELEREGFHLVGVADILGGVVAGCGALAGPALPDVLANDAVLGLRLAQAIGDLDIGQAVVVQQGYTLAVEAAEGTDSLCRRVAGLVLPGNPPLLAKASKPQQDRRLDLPAIGAETVRAAYEGGLAAIIVEVGGVLLIEPNGLRKAAQHYGITVHGLAVTDKDKPSHGG